VKKNPEVSIIIVQYKVKKILLECIESIIDKSKNISFEIIVVDNDEVKNLKGDLHKTFPEVVYVPNDNKGFGQGNNVGAKFAKGEYLFFLNPDTRLVNNAIKSLVIFLQKHKKVGIVAPILQHANGTIFDLQGLSKLTPLRGIVALSFINKLFPDNPISKKYWLLGWDKSKLKEVDAVPGTAFMIKKHLYDECRGFDERFFLYFEEFDLCKKVSDLGKKIIIIPDAKVMHLWGKSTSHRSDLNQVFAESRFYFFKKHYGVLSAIVVEMFARASGATFSKLLFLIFSVTILGYKLPKLMTFIGDQAWFYLSARDLLIRHDFALVGITSSHTWLHQGPLWTYLLTIALWLGNFNPAAGGYLSIGTGLLTIVVLYLITKKILSEKVALVTALLYATSPLVILHARMPYHTSPIPLFVLLYFYSLYQWIHGKKIYLSFSLFFLALLYNFELATVVLVAPFLFVLGYGLIKKKRWVMDLTRKNIFQTVFLIVIPMIPILLYDTTHGFRQTVVYGGWLVMNALRVVGIAIYPSRIIDQPINIFTFTYELLQRLVFLPHGVVALFLLLISVIYALMGVYKQVFTKKVSVGLVLCLIWFIPTVIFYFGNKTPSEAYLPMLFPVIFILIAYFLSSVLKRKLLVVIVVGSICVLNSIYLIKDSYFTSRPGALTLENRENAAGKIIIQSDGDAYSLVGTGIGSQFESFVMPYEYLVWYLGQPSVKTGAQKVFILEEKPSGLKISKKL